MSLIWKGPSHFHLMATTENGCVNYGALSFMDV